MSNDSLVTLITGAGSGIGRDFAIALLKNNHNVTLTGRREKALKETVQLAGDIEGHALVFPSDVSIEQEVVALFQHIKHVS